MKIVFFGDSITDGGRNSADEKSLGNGYVKMLADKIHPLYPDMGIELINKGIAGNEVSDLLARVEKDVLELRPDVVVMMAGINDVLHAVKEDKDLDLKKFADNFEELLLELKDAGITIIMLEPFLLPAPDKRRYRPLFNKALAIIGELAEKHANQFVAYDEMLNGLCETNSYLVYTEDGIHPTTKCYNLIANTSIKAIRRYLI